MEAIEELSQLSDSMRQAAALLADEDVDENSSSSSRRSSTFLNVVALGNVGAGKSAVLNSLIGHPVLPTGENGATRAPISIDLQKDGALSSKSIILQIDNKSQQVSASALRHSLQDRLSKGASGKSRDEIYLKLRTSTDQATWEPALALKVVASCQCSLSIYAKIGSRIPAGRRAPPLKLIDLPGLDQRIMDDSLVRVSEYAEHNDAILLVIIPAAQAPEIASSRALRVAKEFDGDGTRTVGVISKIDQASADQKALAAVQALLLNQGPPKTADISWVALIGQSVSIATAQSGSESSLETAWRAESESLKSILTGAPQSKLGRIALVDALAQQIRKRMKVRVPNVLSGLQGKSQIVQDELVRLGEQMVQSAEGTRSLALELCREFEDKFLQHITTGEGSGWKIVASFEGNFPNRIKQLPLDRHFDINNVKRIVLEADGYQPYLISPEKGLRSLIKGVLELAKEPSRLCVDEVHRVLVDIVSASANATPGLGRYPPFKREVVAIASAALDGFKNEARKMVVALVDMERAFVPPQHFIRLVQRRYSQNVWLATSPQTGGQQTGGSLKAMKDKSSQAEKEANEASALKTAGPEGEITAGFLLKKSAKTNGWSKRWFVLNEKTGKLGYTKKQEERHFRGVIALEECNIEEIPEEEEPPAKSSKDKKANGPDSGKAPSLVFKITSKIPYKTVLKAHNAVVLKAESTADKAEWINKISKVIQARGGLVRVAESGHTMRQSLSDGSLDTMARRPADPEEELRWMSQEVRGYVEAVLNSLAANVPKEDQNVKRRRDRYQKQSELLSKLTRQLSIHDNRAAAASNWSDVGGGAGDDWRSAFDAAANGPVSLRSYSRSASNGHSRRYSDPAENGDVRSGSNSGSRPTSMSSSLNLMNPRSNEYDVSVMAPPSSSRNSNKYDVFLSFRGEDTRDNFTSHLYSALWHNNIETFIDNDLKRGDEISQSLLDTIEASAISITIFSERYASSGWCLDELSKILECKHDYGQIVIPVFCRVDPSHVRRQTGTFGDYFSKLGERYPEKMQRWGNTLTEAANLSGFDSHVIRPESKLVEEIANEILERLDDTFQSYNKDLVGVEWRVKEIESLLCTGSAGVYILGIWGIGEAEETGGIKDLQKELLSDVLNDRILRDVRSQLNRLARKMVLLVFDDVNNPRQIESLIGHLDHLASGSRVIITTRDKQVLKNCWAGQIYQMKELVYKDAQKLFSQYAFRGGHLDSSYTELTDKAIKYAQGVPLALKVLGCYLCGRSKEEWESAMRKLEIIPHVEIQEVLKISYDSLDDSQKNIFLDIACFLEGEHRDKGTEKIKGIFLDMNKVTREIHMNFYAFLKMPNLRFLRMYGDENKCLVSHLEGVPFAEVRHLEWARCPLKTLNICAEKLASLKMPRSKVQQLWDDVQLFVLNMSKRMELMEGSGSVVVLELLGNIVLQKAPPAVKAFLLNEGPPKAAKSESESSLEMHGGHCNFAANLRISFCSTLQLVHVLVEVVSGASNATPSLEDILCLRERRGSYDYVTKYLCT
ncbi:hypothetical protein WN944_015394 [Citrus x changshan-huyou]|uniref:dynamin GTPase n=2 Tax=Citrus TaxID=2706 RepID=A0AAP0M7F8_9ROSI